MIISLFLYPVLKGFIRFGLYLIILIITLGIQISTIDLINIYLILLITSLPFFAIAIISSAFVIYFKQTDPINFFLNILISIFAGILYPVAVLPIWMQKISYLFPLAENINKIREILVNNSVKDVNVYSSYVLQLITSLVMIILSLWLFNLIIDLVKRWYFRKILNS